MIIVIGGIKGGIGKSTIAANLAVLDARAGRNVLLIDADSSDQQTSLRWAAARNEREGLVALTTMALHGRTIRAELKRLAERYDTIIVDPAARDSDTQRSALSVADLVLLPFPPRGPDLWTIDGVVEMIQDVRLINPGLRAACFVNRADSVGSFNEEAELAFAEHADSVESLPIRVGNRKAIATAHLVGLAAIEQPRPDPKAVAELESLYLVLEKDTETVPTNDRGTAS